MSDTTMCRTLSLLINQKVIEIRNNQGTTVKRIVRIPQPWKAGWLRIRYNSNWYELERDKNVLFINIDKVKGIC